MIYKDKKIKSLHIHGKEIAKVYKGDKLVFKKDNRPKVKYKIEILYFKS